MSIKIVRAFCEKTKSDSQTELFTEQQNTGKPASLLDSESHEAIDGNRLSPGCDAVTSVVPHVWWVEVNLPQLNQSTCLLY